VTFQINIAIVQLQSAQAKIRCWWRGSVGWLSGWFSEGKNSLIKNDITRTINTSRINVEALITLMKRAIAEEDAFLEMKG
jgi:hypothetical protein